MTVVSKIMISQFVVSAKVVLTQTYANTSETPTNRAKYVFPVPSRAAVCAFDLEHADGRRIVGVAKEKVKATEEHEKAIQEGKFTGLLEWVTDDGNIFFKHFVPTVDPPYSVHHFCWFDSS